MRVYALMKKKSPPKTPTNVMRLNESENETKNFLQMPGFKGKIWPPFGQAQSCITSHAVKARFSVS